jgi:transcriptional regulator of met regulon
MYAEHKKKQEYVTKIELNFNYQAYEILCLLTAIG